ncbi:MAG: type II toxin-antitoxin system ParD family antitoxin [Marinobacter sp.]
MQKHTSITLGQHFDAFIAEQLKNGQGRWPSVTDLRGAGGPRGQAITSSSGRRGAP